MSQTGRKNYMSYWNFTTEEKRSSYKYSEKW